MAENGEKGQAGGNEAAKGRQLVKKRDAITLGVFLLVLLVLAATNPGQEAHVEAFRAAELPQLEQELREEAEASGQDPDLVTPERVLDGILMGTSYNNYVVYSSLTDHQDDRLSFGILGRVYAAPMEVQDGDEVEDEDV